MYNKSDGNLPAPYITNSRSFNEKLKFIKNKKQENVDILAIGSSITLNNLNSAIITNEFKGRYLNASSWGLSIKEVDELVESVFNTKEIKLIIIVSNVMDFVGSDIEIKAEDIKSYLHASTTNIQYLTHWNLRYMWSSIAENNRDMKSRNIKSSLMFDNWGSVPLELYGDDIDKRTWSFDLPFDKIDETQYKYLDWLCYYLKSRNIKLIFVNSPVRSGLVNNEYAQKISIHNEKIEGIISRYNQSFVNMTTRKWPDSLFVDYAHFNANGSKVFTEGVIEAIHLFNTDSK